MFLDVSLECSAPLGMVNGAIKKDQVTASSSLAPYSPDMARLNSLSAWCASNGQNGQYIQVGDRVRRACSGFCV